jgi:hypothetical protein
VLPLLLLAIGAAVALALAARWFARADPKAVVRMARWLALGAGGALALFLLATGRFSSVVLTVPVLVAAFLDWHRLIGRLLGSGRTPTGGQAGHPDAPGEARPPRPPDPRAMTHAEAWALLGLQPGAGPEAVKAAHRRLMKLHHPDQGGSTALAARLNAARDRLLGA